MTLTIERLQSMHWRRSTRPPSKTGGEPPAKSGSPSATPTRSVMRRAWDCFEDFLGWPIDLLLRHFEKRLFELAMTVAMMGEGLLLLMSPRSVESSAFRFIINVMPMWLCIVIFIGLGGARVVALILNGHWMPSGAYVRAIGAVAGAVMWGQMCASLWTFNMVADTPVSPGIPIYATLTLFEIVSMYFALVGARAYGSYR